MANLAVVIFFSLIGGIVSLVGGFILILNKSNAKRLVDFATPFAAGALLAAAFMDLLPEAVEAGDAHRALFFTLVGIIGFFLLERFLQWFHHHHEHESTSDGNRAQTIPLIIIGDTIHNFIDGIVIASGFLVSVETGVVVTLAVAAHEIPQEIGDFGLLLSKGVSRKKVIIVNVISALATVVAAVLFFQFGQSHVDNLDVLLGLVAGFFIYIATSDIIPTIHRKDKNGLLGRQTIMLILGVVTVGLLNYWLHGAIEHETETSHEVSVVVSKTE